MNRIATCVNPMGGLLLMTEDELVVRRPRRLAAEHGLTDPNHGGEPAVVVIDIERAGALAEITELRARYPLSTRS